MPSTNFAATTIWTSSISRTTKPSLPACSPNSRDSMVARLWLWRPPSGRKKSRRRKPVKSPFFFKTSTRSSHPHPGMQLFHSSLHSSPPPSPVAPLCLLLCFLCSSSLSSSSLFLSFLFFFLFFFFFFPLSLSLLLGFFPILMASSPFSFSE